MDRTVVILAAGRGTRISPFRREVPKPLVRLCGLTLIERTIRSARREGFTRFVVVTGYRGDEIRESLGTGRRFDVEIRYAENDEWRKNNGVSLLKAKSHVETDEFLLLMSDHVVSPAIYQQAASASLNGDELLLFTDAKIDKVYDLEDATKVHTFEDRIVDIGKQLTEFETIDTGVFLCSKSVFDTLQPMVEERGDASLSEGVLRIAKRGKARVEDVGEAWWQDVDTGGAYRHAERLLLQAQRKPGDVFVSRYFNRPVSLFISKYLCRTSIRPDVVSFISMASGLLAPFFLIQGEYWGFITGAFFYHFSSVLDGCDGEIARLKFMESDRGEWVDTIADVATHFFFLVGLTVGLYVASANTFYAFMGWTAFFGMSMLLITMFNYLTKVAKRGSLIAFERDYTSSVSGDRDWATNLARLLKPLLRRATFAFLFLILAILGRSDVILFLMSFGTNLALILVYSTFRKRLRAMEALEPTP